MTITIKAYHPKIHKKVDKYKDTVYNIGIDKNTGNFKFDCFSMIALENSLTKNYFGKGLAEVYNKTCKAIENLADIFPRDSYPVISGAWVFDYLYALMPKDIDIFINTNGLTKDEADDLVDLFIHYIDFKHSEELNTENSTYPDCFRVINFRETLTYQFIFKDFGFPGFNNQGPLGLTKDFGYSLGMVALPIVPSDTVEPQIILSKEFLYTLGNNEALVYTLDTKIKSKLSQKLYTLRLYGGKSWSAQYVKSFNHSNNTKKNNFDYVTENIKYALSFPKVQQLRRLPY